MHANAHNRRILLIDDVDAIHQDFRKILVNDGVPRAGLDAARLALFGAPPARQQAASFELDSASQGEEGWHKVRAARDAGQPYALAFIDMRMPPGWDGVETAAKLWELDPNLQIVICTAYADYSLDEMLGRLDARDRLLILKKPFDPAEVRQLANALTSKWHYARAASAQMGGLEQLVRDRTRALTDTNLALQAEIAERTTAERSLRLKHLAIESSVNAIFLSRLRPSGHVIEYVNPAFEKITGYAAGEVMGKPLDFLMSPDRDQEAAAVLRDAVQRGVSGHAVMRNVRKDGAPFWCEWSLAPVNAGGIQAEHFIGILNDITTARALEEQLQRRADYDPLTGLPNRLLLMDRIEQAVAQAQRQEGSVVLAMVDLDRFKFINDSLGRDAGDAVLKEMALRLQACVHDSDTVARLGGDEFVVLMQGDLVQEDMLPAMQRIVERVAVPVRLQEHDYVVTCSVGISVFPQDGTAPEALLKHAERAMYQAKEQGRNNFRFFMQEMNVRLRQRLQLESELHTALALNQFELHYQAQLDLHSGAIIGCEALLRWNHPARGLLMPDDFIWLAEESDLILHIGAWALRTACVQRRAWNDAGLPPLPVAVNLSPRQFERQDVVALVGALLKETGLEPGMIELEMTETLSMREPQRTIALISTLRTMGVGVAIDDFGTGYSNLSYLKKFPVSKIKLDRSFVQDITNNPEDVAISSAVIEIGHSLHLKVIAEGVERASQLAILRAHGCDQLQGFLFGPAVPAAHFAALVLAGQTLALDADGAALSERSVLLLDDDPHAESELALALEALPCRVLRAPRSEQAFSMLETHAVDVVLANCQTADVHVLELLANLAHRHPDTMRILLSTDVAEDALLGAINQGTLFKFLRHPWSRSEVLHAVEQAFHEAQRRHAEPTVLVVDDNERDLAFASAALAGRPYRVLCARNVGDAFELLALRNVDVVLSDHRMPDMSGLEFLGRVQRMYPRPVRMLLSGFPAGDMLQDAINKGLLFKFLCKPCAPDELADAVDAAFARGAEAR